MEYDVRPLTPDLRAAFEDLFGEHGAVNGCWCMYWRIGSEYRRRPHGENKAAFHDGLAVGWCQLTPRDALPWLDRTWRLRRVDDAPVWSLSCFYVRIGHRRRGVMTVLIAGALDYARRAGAHALEAYPLDASLTPSSSSTGYVSTFRRMGFKIVGRRVPPRPIMRYEF